MIQTTQDLSDKSTFAYVVDSAAMWNSDRI